MTHPTARRHIHAAHVLLQQLRWHLATAAVLQSTLHFPEEDQEQIQLILDTADAMMRSLETLSRARGRN